MDDNRIHCPLLDKEIEDIDCIETSDAVEGILKLESVPDNFKKKIDWKEICKSCKYHNY